MECESVVESDSHFYYLESSVFLLYFISESIYLSPLED